ncbi:hypothetical protein LNP74_28055 [Klebsiella pneumoniae subsp. pneumoniae]|nr:hypothetical protein [Klebsiella pneumoniae subsp. pneumoniae]
MQATHAASRKRRDFHGDLLLTIVLQPLLDCHPSAAPSRWGVPLLAAKHGGGGQPAGFKQARLGGGATSSPVM